MKISRRWRSAAIRAAIVIQLMAGVSIAGGESESKDGPKSIRYPNGNRPSNEEVELGKVLFFDPRLSSNGKLSCATCHDPALGFADGKPFSTGVSGNALTRHTPHLLNLAWGASFFWDGRAKTLEEQALMPIQAPDEMGSALADVIKKLEQVSYYRATFARVYPKKGLSAGSIAKAIASFERSLIVENSSYDRYKAGDKDALSADAVGGMNLFFGKAQCFRCHGGANFTDGGFHNTGIPGTDLGRVKQDRVGEFQMKPYPFFQMQRAFKTPGLRNVATTAPYFHDGSESTLLNVVRFYNQGGKDTESAGLSSDVRPLNLTEIQMKELVAFLEALTSPLAFTKPEIPPYDGTVLKD